MCIHKICEEAMHAVPQLRVCPTRHMASLNEVEEARVKTDYKKFTNNK